MRTWFSLIVLAAIGALAMAGEGEKNQAGENTLHLVKELKPAPPETIAKLLAVTWENKGTKNILGAGMDEIVSFSRDGGGKLTLTRTDRRFGSVNQANAAGRQPLNESKTTAACSVDQYVIRYADQQQTFVVTDNELILNALVPLGDGKWYYAARRVLGPGKFMDEELLYEFAADPLKAETGKGTLEVRSATGAQKKFPIRFEVTRKDQHGRLMQVVADAANQAKWGQILLAEGGAYGRMLNHADQKSEVFQAQK